jgi:hypothetical protein
MPSGVSDFGATAWLAALFAVSEPITGYYLALCSDEPGAGMDGDLLADLEPVDSSYHRVGYGVGADNWGANGNYLTNSLDIDFGLPSEDWGDISHYALCTAISSGELYAWGEFLNPQFVQADYQLLIPAGALVLTLSALDNLIAI